MTLTVIVTRPRNSYDAAGSIEDDIRAIGAAPCALEVVELQPFVLTEHQKHTLLSLVSGGRDDARWVFFLSPNAVFFTRQQLAQCSVYQLGDAIRIAAQGPGTADAVRACFARAPDFQPSVSVAESLVDEFLTFQNPNDPSGVVVLPESASGRHVVGPALERAGWKVESVTLYDSVIVTPSPKQWSKIMKLPPREVCFLFMSPMAVRGVVQAACESGDAVGAYSAITIGPTTLQAAKDAGFSDVVVAPTHDRNGVLSAVTSVLQRTQKETANGL